MLHRCCHSLSSSPSHANLDEFVRETEFVLCRVHCACAHAVGSLSLPEPLVHLVECICASSLPANRVVSVIDETFVGSLRTEVSARSSAFLDSTNMLTNLNVIDH